MDGGIDKPPKHLSFVYGFDPAFDGVGEAFLEYFKEYGQLKPDGTVLDVGCGIGRCAIPLTAYLSEEGFYRGIDIRKDGVDWCTQNIESKFPNFQFQRSDIKNATYHPQGKVDAREYIFPYEGDSFDLIFTKSVFTHLQYEVIEQYLKETFRMLKPGAYSLHTFFLLNQESQGFQSKGLSQFDFKYPFRGGAVVSKVEPEKAIAFDEALILDLYQTIGLEVVKPIHYGSWCGRPDFLSGQDLVVARKPL